MQFPNKKNKTTRRTRSETTMLSLISRRVRALQVSFKPFQSYLPAPGHVPASSTRSGSTKMPRRFSSSAPLDTEPQFLVGRSNGFLPKSVFFFFLGSSGHLNKCQRTLCRGYLRSSPRWKICCKICHSQGTMGHLDILQKVIFPFGFFVILPFR